MKRTIDRVDMGAAERLPSGDITHHLGRKYLKIVAENEKYRIVVSPAFDVAIVRKPDARGRDCKRKRSVEDAGEEDDLSLLRPLKRPCLDLSLPTTIHDISPYLLADILEFLSALKRPALRRVCRSWNAVLTQKSTTNNNICVIESSKKYHQCHGEEDWIVRVGRFIHHVDDIRRVVTPSTKTLVMLFPSVKDPKDRFDLSPRFLKHLREMMAVPRVVMVNVASHDYALVPATVGEEWDRPMDLHLVNFSLLIRSFHPKLDVELPVVLIDKLSVYLPGSLFGNSQAILNGVDRMIWPFNEAQQLEWVVKYSSLVDYSHRIPSYLTRRRLELGVPLEHPDVSSEDRIRRADHFALGVIACHMLGQARKGKIPPPPILFPGA